MTVCKYRITLANMPSQLITDFEGTPVLKLRLTTQFGRKDVILREGEIIRTEDPLVKAALEGYGPPKMVPIIKKPRGEVLAADAMYNHEDYKDVRPFTKVANNLSHHIEL